ncbi:MAG: agmatine deiminase family protein [Candidatus Binataceae bacterium]
MAAPALDRLCRAYRMPAEWAPHLATYLVWPHNHDTWPGKFETIPPVFARMAAAIAWFEPVRILIENEAAAGHVRALIAAAPCLDDDQPRLDRVELIPVPTNDSWIRDHGPIFINRIAPSEHGETDQIALDWRFNSWGNKYGPVDLDDVVARHLGELYGVEVVEPGIVLEGGSIDVNGAGLLLTTESCLLNPNRNPSLTREEIEGYLRVYLGIDKVLWLNDGIAGDDTDGHVDDLARFTSAKTIVTVVEDDPADTNYQALRENLRRLRGMRDQYGRQLHTETLPMPPACFYEGMRLPASYANFYIVNGGVIMPSFGCAADSIAQSTLQRLFSGRRVVTVPAIDLVWGLGAIHCLTQQHPVPPRFA